MWFANWYTSDDFEEKHCHERKKYIKHSSKCIQYTGGNHECSQISGRKKVENVECDIPVVVDFLLLWENAMIKSNLWERVFISVYFQMVKSPSWQDGIVSSPSWQGGRHHGKSRELRYYMKQRMNWMWSMAFISQSQWDTSSNKASTPHSLSKQHCKIGIVSLHSWVYRNTQVINIKCENN